MNYYAVYKGHEPNIYFNWSDAEMQVIGYSGAVYQKFKRIEEAEYFMQHGVTRPLTLKPIPVKKKVSIKPKKRNIDLDMHAFTMPKIPIDNTEKKESTTVKPFSIPVVPEKSSVPIASDLLDDKLVAYYKHADYDPNSDVINIYTDGSTTNNGHHSAYGGYGVFMPCTNYFNEEIITKKQTGKITNNTAELNAIISALKLILLNTMNYIQDEEDEPAEISWNIIYDSDYAAGVITGKKRAKTNLDLVDKGKRLLNECKQNHILVKFTHTYSHQNIVSLFDHGNDIADFLAKAAGTI